MDSSDVSDGSRKQHRISLQGNRQAELKLPQITSTRSRTDPPAPESQQHQKSQIHRRLGSSALRNRTFHVTGTGSGEHQHHSRRQQAKDAVQSAIELKPPISFEHLLRRDKKNTDASRQGNVTSSSQGQTQRDSRDAATQQREDEEQRKVSPAEVETAKQQNAIRESELRESLRKVEEVAMSSTRRLDDTYYAILEKATFIRSTLASLQQLADESRQIHHTFQDDCSRLERDVQQKLNSFENFDPQEEAVNNLVSKLSRAREKTDRLNQRLEDAWTRVENYEHNEKSKEDTRRKRWRWSSFVTFVILCAIVAVFTSKHRRTVTDGLHGAVKQLDELGGDMLFPVAALLKPIIHREEDPYLQKLFDEL